jgi:methionine-rich copper-binding protein CopC
MRKIIATLALGLLLAGAAQAHAHLQQSEPAAGAAVSPGPNTLTLHFSEGVEPKFSSVAITMDDGMDMGPATVATDPKDAKSLIATLPAKLGPGNYTIAWQVVSVDTHKTNGTYSFTVKP